MMQTRSAYLLLALGLLQISGDVFGLPVLRGLGAATMASPAPRVFTTREGVEGFSARFFIEWQDQSIELTPQLYSRLRGPYNRRNIYGAALAGGPVLKSNPKLRPMWDAVAFHALCGDAPLLRELGIHPTGAVRLRLQPRRGGKAIILDAPCR